jgi:hypothetical protein
MKTFAKLLILLSVLISTNLKADNWPDHVGDIRGVAIGAGGTITGNLALDCPFCVIYGVEHLTDTLPNNLMMKASNATPIASGANQMGGLLVLRGGIGTRLVTITDYTKLVGGNDTVTFSITGINTGVSPPISVVATTLTAVTGAPGASQFQCITSNDLCASNLSVAINAIFSDLTYVWTNQVRFEPRVETISIGTIVIADGGADGPIGVATNGANGSVLMTDGMTATPSFSFAGDPDTGFYRTTSGSWVFVYGSASRVTIGNTVVQISNVPLNVVSQRIYDSGGALQIGSTAATSHGLATGSVIDGSALEIDGATWMDGEVYGQVEADLTAGACTAKRMVVDTGGASREFCRCNSGGTAYDCCTIAAASACSTNGPVD